MVDRRHGIAAEIAAAGPLTLPDEAEQVDLFDGDPAAGSPIEGTARALGLGGQISPHRRGRRPGSQNVTTQDVLRFLGQRYRHPLLGLADIASTNWRDLAEMLVPEPQGPDAPDEPIGGDGAAAAAAPAGDRTPGEIRAELASIAASRVTREDMFRAAQLQIRCAEILAEYMLPKQPRMVTVTADSAPLMVFDLGSDQLTRAGVTAAIDQVMGFAKMPMNTGPSLPIGGEVLEAEVLQGGITPEKSNG